MKSITLIVCVFLFGFSLPLKEGGEFCGLPNQAFQAGESITFKVYYTLAGVYIAAGEAVFTVVLEDLNGKPVYHVTGTGKNFSFLDNQVYNLYIRYVGKETIKTKYGKFHAIKIKPLLIKGTIFEGGEKMTVW